MLIDIQKTIFIKTMFVKSQEYEHGEWLKVKIHILFYGDS
jgi:hypothetical protein